MRLRVLTYLLTIVFGLLAWWAIVGGLLHAIDVAGGGEPPAIDRCTTVTACDPIVCGGDDHPLPAEPVTAAPAAEPVTAAPVVVG